MNLTVRPQRHRSIIEGQARAAVPRERPGVRRTKLEGPKAMAERLIKLVYFSGFVVVLVSSYAHADVVPAEEDACKGAHRAGDACLAETEPGTCQASKCDQVDWDRYKGEAPGERPMKKVACLKCIAKPTRGSACAMVHHGSANRGFALWALAVAVPVVFLTARRRRPLSNKPLKTDVVAAGASCTIVAPAWRRPHR